MRGQPLPPMINSTLCAAKLLCPSVKAARKERPTRVAFHVTCGLHTCAFLCPENSHFLHAENKTSLPKAAPFSCKIIATQCLLVNFDTNSKFSVKFRRQLSHFLRANTCLHVEASCLQLGLIASHLIFYARVWPFVFKCWRQT